MLSGIVLGLVWFVLFLVLHVGLFHFFDIHDRFGTISKLFVGAVACHLASSWVLAERGRLFGGLASGGVLGAISGVVVLCSLFILYMPFYYTVDASISVRMLVEILGAPGHQLSMTQLRATVALEERLQQRLDTMAENGYLVWEGGGYRLTPKGRGVARVFRLIGKAWRLGPGG